MDKTNSLTPSIRRILLDKETEFPHTGLYNSVEQRGTYLCRRCGLALFRTNDQFHSGCGWPSFDNAVLNAIQVIPDADGRREEIVCQRCKGHLGHVFTGEQFTDKNIRHCVNSASLDFVSDPTVEDSEEAIVAGGCFWGIEHFFRQLPDVLGVEVGYTGGRTHHPHYEEVCSGMTGHYEAVRVLFNPKKISYSEIIKYFFEIHDPTQNNGQGPDIGSQYHSAIFYFNDEQQSTAESLIQILKTKGFHITTHLLEVQPFWPAENYHQAYYLKHDKLPYCHRFEKRF